MTAGRAIIGALALWLAFSGVAAAEQLYVNEGGWWREGGAFNVSGTPIQAAVDAADAGDSIYVWNGSYSENVDVDKARLTLEGEGADVVTVTAADSGDHVFEVTADYVNISGFTVTGATDIWVAGVSLASADHCNISRNIASNNYDGIYMSYSNDNTLTNNTANSNKRYGIYLWYYSSYNTLMGNIANSNNRCGTYLNYYSSDNTLTSNIASDSEYGIWLDYSSDNTLTNNTASDNFAGIWLDYSSDNTLTNNTANSNKQYGIRLSFYSSDNTLTNNNASNNGYGIWPGYSSNNTLTNNTISGNTNYGMYLVYSSDNEIYHNNFIDNNKQAYDHNGFNSWDKGASVGGNYWSDHACHGNPSNGAEPYNGIDTNAGAVDTYPFEELDGWATPPPPFTTADVAIALQIAVGSSPFDSRYDVSGDGSVTSLDALMILQAAAGSIEIG
jgi:parallel beta-helix repeat protein